MSLKLSQLNLSGLVARSRIVPEEEQRPTKPHRVTMWECAVCWERHEEREEAVKCCAVKAEASSNDAQPCCPVCGIEYGDYRDAADCCLWRDLTADTRWTIADRVASGTPWVEALEQTP